MQQRLGWLLVALFLMQKLPFINFAHGSTMGARKVANELVTTPTTVRVKLSDLGRVMTIKGTDLALSLAKKPELGNVRSDQWIVDCKRSLIIAPLTGKSRVIPRSGVLIESLSGILAINERRFREQIVVYPKELLSPYDSSIRKNTECLVVNHIQIEKYLESVVNAEFNSQWAESAVQAQIIAARTYALYQMKEMRKDRGRVFDVESTQKDQVYLGLDSADLRGTQLVAKTRGMIMTPKDGTKLDPIKAFYSASCGGETSLPQQVWGARFAGFTKKVQCPYCAGSPSYAWNYKMSFADIEKKIVRGLEIDTTNRKVWPKAYTSNPRRWTLSMLRTIGGPMHDHPKRKGATLMADAHADEVVDHRVQDLVFEFIDRKDPSSTLKVKMDAYQARNWLGPAQLKSTLFSLSTSGRSIVFNGKGSGHGVGMCQWGAKRMGEKGFTRDQILTHYYPGVKIARIW